MTSLPQSTGKKLGLAIDLDTCVGCQACVTACKGWNDQGYGQFVIIDHNIDYLTLYAHLEQIFVTEAQIVGQGQLLGLVGSTGNSTGPHLHFEIRDFGQRVNPLEGLTR